MSCTLPRARAGMRVIIPVMAGVSLWISGGVGGWFIPPARFFRASDAGSRHICTEAVP